MTLIEHCLFPDDLLYDYDGNTWVKLHPDTGEATIGVTSLLAGIAGKLLSVKVKDVGTSVARGRSLGTIESHRMVGPLPSPFTGTILAINELVISKPKRINDSPYQEGWIIKLKLSHRDSEGGHLMSVESARSLLEQRVIGYHVRCFKAFPDHEMFEIGTECSAVLVRLNELMAKIPVGEVVHIVSDDPTSDVEMVAWSDRFGQDLVEHRTEGSLHHFIVRKTID